MLKPSYDKLDAAVAALIAETTLTDAFADAFEYYMTLRTARKNGISRENLTIMRLKRKMLKFAAVQCRKYSKNFRLLPENLNTRRVEYHFYKVMSL